MIDPTKLAGINKANADNLLADQKHKELLDSSIKTSNTVLSATASLIRYLEGQITKTQVINQLESIGTPDVFEVVDAVNNLHATLKTHKNTDLSQVTQLMTQLLDEAKQIPKEIPEEKEQQFIDYSDQFTLLADSIKAVEQVVKEQKLIAEAPIVNVPETNVNVEAPDLKPLQTSIKDVVTAVNKIIIPKTDNKEVEKLVIKSNKLLKDILDKPVSSGGGGGGRATPYQDSNSVPAFVVLESQGSIPVSMGFDPKSDVSTSIVTVGSVKTVTSTDGVKTQTITIDSTDPNNKLIASVWL